MCDVVCAGTNLSGIGVQALHATCPAAPGLLLSRSQATNTYTFTTFRFMKQTVNIQISPCYNTIAPAQLTATPKIMRPVCDVHDHLPIEVGLNSSGVQTKSCRNSRTHSVAEQCHPMMLSCYVWRIAATILHATLSYTPSRTIYVDRRCGMHTWHMCIHRSSCSILKLTEHRLKP
jgi:hypothetical protein